MVAAEIPVPLSTGIEDAVIRKVKIQTTDFSLMFLNIFIALLLKTLDQLRIGADSVLIKVVDLAVYRQALGICHGAVGLKVVPGS